MQANAPANPDSRASGLTAEAEARERDDPERDQVLLTERRGPLRAALVPAHSPAARVPNASRAKEKAIPLAQTDCHIAVSVVEALPT